MAQFAERAINYATSPEGLGYEIENVILIGRSIGTGVAVESAAKFPRIKGMILISAFLSIRDVTQHVAGPMAKYFVSDIFKNNKIIEKIKCPTLFIHGKKDQLIPCIHSLNLYKQATCSKKLVLADEMSHNRSKVEKDIYSPIENFLLEELKINDLSSLNHRVSRYSGPKADILSLKRQRSAPESMAEPNSPIKKSTMLKTVSTISPEMHKFETRGVKVPCLLGKIEMFVKTEESDQSSPQLKIDRSMIVLGKSLSGPEVKFKKGLKYKNQGFDAFLYQ